MPTATEIVAFNQTIIEEFRANQGRVGGMFEGLPMLLLHSTGARSGQVRISPLAYGVDSDHFVIIGSKGGVPTNPDWVYNLRANPMVTLEFGKAVRRALAEEATGEERDQIYEATAAVLPNYREYQQATTRRIPVFRLELL